MRTLWLSFLFVISCRAVASDTTFTRQWVAIKYNVASTFFLVGSETSLAVAPVNWLHIQPSYRVYEMGWSGLAEGTAHRTSWDIMTDVRFQYNEASTFSGFFAGPYYSYGRLNLQYKEKVGPYDETHYDRFDIHRHVLGGTFGYSAVMRKHPKVLLEAYLGAGRAIVYTIGRRTPEHPELTDHTLNAENQAKVQLRFGLSIGYIFF